MWHRLAFRLPALVAVGLLLAVGLATTLGVTTARSELREQAITETQRKLDGYLAGVEQYHARARELLALSLHHHVTGRDLRPRDFRAAAHDLLESAPLYEYALFLDRDGRARFVESRSARTVAASQSWGDRRWFRRALDGKHAVSDLELSLLTGRPTVLLADPVRDEDGRIVGVWAGGLRLKALSRMGTAPGGRPAREAHGFVTDSQGLILAHQGNIRYVEQQTDFSTVPPVQAALAGRRFAGRNYNPVEQQWKVAASAPLPGTGWAVVFASPERVALRPVKSLTERLVQAGLLAGGVLAVLAWWVVRRSLRPLQDLRDAAERMRGGDLGVRVPISDAHTEVGLLGTEMNRMAVSLEDSDRALRDKTERLEATVARLDAVVSELDSFSYSVSHDLRAPLRAISGFTEAVLKENPDLDEHARERLARVTSATQRMSKLIEDLLGLSRISRAPLSLARVDVSSEVESLVAERREQEADREVDVSVQPGMQVRADRDLLLIALRNLLDNAWKFTAKTPSAHIDVHLDATADGPEIVVRDNGAGYNPAYGEKLFAPFQRLHRQSDFPGTGVGLATVRRVAMRHGGGVSARGAPEDGAEFRVHLPMAAYVSPPVDAQPDPAGPPAPVPDADLDKP